MNVFSVLLMLAAIGAIWYFVRRNRRDPEPRNPAGDRDDNDKPGKDRV